jgi:membrane protein
MRHARALLLAGAKRFGVGVGAAGAVLGAWMRDGGPSMSAALAFYSAFSLAPLLVLALALAGFFFGADAVQGRLFSGIEGVVGEDGAVAVQVMVANAWKTGGGGWTGWLSLGAMMIGASATFAELKRALNIIWRAPAPSTVAGMVRLRLMSFGLVMGTGFLIVVLLIADAIVVYATELVWGVEQLDPLLQYLEQTISLLFLATAFSVLLKVVPDASVRWAAALSGGLAAALLFTVGKQLFARYLAYAGTANAFGAAGSFAVLMMWLFFSAAVFLLGAHVAAFLGRYWEKRTLRHRH